MTEQELIKQFQALKKIQPRREWLGLTRLQLMSEVDKEIVHVSFWDDLRDWLRQPQMDALAVCLLIIFLGGPWLAVKASQASLPGEWLYSLKRASEDIQTSVVSEEKKSQLQVEFAVRRLEELDKLTQSNENGEKAEKVKEVITYFKTNLAGASVYANRISPDKAILVAKRTRRITESLGKTKEELVLPKEVEGDLTEAEEAIKEINHHILTVLTEQKKAKEEIGETASTTDQEIITFLLEEELASSTEEVEEPVCQEPGTQGGQECQVEEEVEPQSQEEQNEEKGSANSSSPLD